MLLNRKYWFNPVNKYRRDYKSLTGVLEVHGGRYKTHYSCSWYLENHQNPEGYGYWMAGQFIYISRLNGWCWNFTSSHIPKCIGWLPNHVQMLQQPKWPWGIGLWDHLTQVEGNCCGGHLYSRKEATPCQGNNPGINHQNYFKTRVATIIACGTWRGILKSLTELLFQWSLPSTIWVQSSHTG